MVDAMLVINFCQKKICKYMSDILLLSQKILGINWLLCWACFNAAKWYSLIYNNYCARNKNNLNYF
jgi:hypothetical protein